MALIPSLGTLPFNVTHLISDKSYLCSPLFVLSVEKHSIKKNEKCADDY